MTGKNSEEDAGTEEGYGEPKEKVPLAGVASRKPCSANKQTAEGLVFGCIHPAATHRIYRILVSKGVSSSHPDQLCSPLPRRYQSIQERC